MAMYFFDTDVGETSFMDEIGSKLADDQAAGSEASLTMAELARHYMPGGAQQKNIAMRVRNEQGVAVLQLALTFTIQTPS